MSDPQKSWQARIAEATDALGQDFVESVSYDWRLYKQDIAGSIAHATMLAKVGLITDDDRDAIVAGLKEIETEIDRDGPRWPGFKKELEDIHMCVEASLIERIGEPGRRLHTGRSRNDQVATDLAMWVQDAADEYEGKVADLQRAFARVAEKSLDIVIPSYTHLQRAQPVAAAGEALAWAAVVDAGWGVNTARNLACSQMPLGSGAIAGSSLPLDPDVTLRTDSMIRRTADDGCKFGYFDSGPESSIAATASRDAALHFVFGCAMTAMHLSRWAEQWIIYSTAEFGFIKTADRYTTGSSMMPQKRNPDMLELIRGRCGNVYGSLVSLLVICKGLPIGYNRDLQEDKRHVFAAYDTVSSCLTMAAAIVNSTNFVADRCEAACEGGFMDATSLAEYLVVKGVPFRTAHQIVGGLVAQCEREGKTKLSQLTVDDFNAAIARATTRRESEAHDEPRASDANGSAGASPSRGSPAHVTVTDEVYSCLGARNVVARYQSAGAAGGEPLKKQLAEWKRRLGV